jgi:hypothetical protein
VLHREAWRTDTGDEDFSKVSQVDIACSVRRSLVATVCPQSYTYVVCMRVCNMHEEKHVVSTSLRQRLDLSCSLSTSLASVKFLCFQKRGSKPHISCYTSLAAQAIRVRCSWTLPKTRPQAEPQQPASQLIQLSKE